MRILVAEDERDLNGLITKKLAKSGYSVDSCFDGEEALSYMDFAEYDAIILDIMMPKKDGFAVIREIRQRGLKTPVIFLTARDSIEDRVSGLDLGANDYLVKPFSFDELLARLRAMTRVKYGMAENVLTLDGLTVDCLTHEVKRDGNIISLSAKEYTMLEYMMRNAGIVLSREKLENHVWNYDYDGGTNLVDVYVSYLRKKIDGGFDKKLIKTVRGFGYVISDE
ncbi:MAG TPA: DNA-binding response regulator [Ruminococcaceae bacterium]|nr:DNA-binding response regulator [Oscillospiraceae bacterium]